MKICIAQTHPIKGNVQQNIEDHLQIIKRAIELHADLIVFPELSVTGYEPELAKQLATNIEESLFDPFQKLANEHTIAIGIGMPTEHTDGIRISILMFQPNKERINYSKQTLHSDELSYFVNGDTQIYLNIEQQKIAFGICYETLQREHLLNARNNGATLYIASVAKPESGITKAYKHYPFMANELNMPILMANCVGFCDNFLSMGGSAVWNGQGKLVNKLNSKDPGLLVYDTVLGTATIDQLVIEKGQLPDLEELFQIYMDARAKLESQGFFQWTDHYPTLAIIENGLQNSATYILKNGPEIVGAIHISEEQEKEYATVSWEFDDTKVLVIHRLVVSPKYQQKGYANKLMDFAEAMAMQQAYTSIRLDAYSQNTGVIKFYKKRGYQIRGEVRFPEREFSFCCLEKKINTTL